jgi:hypothetical protein
MEPTKKTQEIKTDAPKMNAAVKTGLPLTKENMEKWVADGKSLRFIEDTSGQGRYHVMKALKTFGLKTKSMRDGAGKLPFVAMNAIYEAIQNGITDENEIAIITSVDAKVVATAIKKMMKEGAIKTVIAATIPKKVLVQAPVQ